MKADKVALDRFKDSLSDASKLNMIWMFVDGFHVSFISRCTYRENGDVSTRSEETTLKIWRASLGKEAKRLHECRHLEFI